MIVLNLILLSVFLASISLAPFVPTRKRDLERIIRLADLKPGQIFYDLGCGSGRVVLAAAKTGSKAVGIELSWPNYIYCQMKKMLIGERRAVFKFGDFYRKDIREADVVYFFGTPKGIDNKFKKMLQEGLRPGTKIISYAFPMVGWPEMIRDKPNEKEVAIYLYKV